MGIRDLSKLLRERCGDSYKRDVPMKEFAYKRIAVDAAIYVFKYKIVFRDRVVDAYVDLVSRLRGNKIHPVFVFDGKSPPEKADEQKKREEERVVQENRIRAIETDLTEYAENGTLSTMLEETYSKYVDTSILVNTDFDYDQMVEYVDKLKARVFRVGASDYALLKETLDVMGVPWLQAPNEAEMLCAQLCKQGLVAGVMSADSDLLAAHCPVVIREVNRNDTMTCIYFADVLDKLNFTPEQFTDLCIMCGTDFNKNIPRVGYKTAMNLIARHGRIENVPVGGKEILNHERVRELFRHDEWTGKVPFCRPIRYDVLEEWLRDKRSFVDVDKMRQTIG